MHARSLLGQAGEDAAAALLLSKGCVLLDRNWRCAGGEIDLIARRGETLVFCEVKARRSSRYGAPYEAVNPRKQARLRALAGRWLSEHRVRARGVRFDVVSVLFTAEGPRLEHFEGAF
jgi:putative endonuclease